MLGVGAGDDDDGWAEGDGAVVEGDDPVEESSSVVRCSANDGRVKSSPIREDEANDAAGA